MDDKTRAIIPLGDSESDASKNMMCTDCGAYLHWEECPVCLGFGSEFDQGQGAICPRCDGEGGSWECECDKEE